MNYFEAEWRSSEMVQERLVGAERVRLTRHAPQGQGFKVEILATVCAAWRLTRRPWTKGQRTSASVAVV